jgi:DNA-binding transcriptional regulator YiaG
LLFSDIRGGIYGLGDHMTPEDFRTKRKDLGLSVVALTRALSVGNHPGPNERTVRRWEKGEWPIPGMAVLAIQQLKKSKRKP